MRGILVTEGVHGDGGVLRNSEGNRFMFDYIPPMFAAETADSEDEADKWYDDHSAGRRPPELLPRDEVARSIDGKMKAGRGSPHGGVFLDIATRRSAEDIRRRLPSMYHQFKELAGVDVAAEAMEVGPTCHYVMGGVRVDADSAATTVAGLFRRRRSGRRDARRQPARWQLPFRPAGVRAAGRVRGRPIRRGPDGHGQCRPGPSRGAAIEGAVAPFERPGGENPYEVHHDLQEIMQSLVGIIRTGSELEEALGKLEALEERAKRVSVSGGRRYNPGWDLTTDLPAMLTVSRSTTLGAINRKEGRRGHTRDDSRNRTPRWARSISSSGSRPAPSPRRGRRNPLDPSITVSPEPIPVMPDDLKELLEEAT